MIYILYLITIYFRKQTTTNTQAIKYFHAGIISIRPKERGRINQSSTSVYVLGYLPPCIIQISNNFYQALDVKKPVSYLKSFKYCVPAHL